MWGSVSLRILKFGTGTDRHDPDKEAGVAGEKQEDGDVVRHQVQPPVGRGERTVQ